MVDAVKALSLDVVGIILAYAREPREVAVFGHVDGLPVITRLACLGFCGDEVLVGESGPLYEHSRDKPWTNSYSIHAHRIDGSSHRLLFLPRQPISIASDARGNMHVLVSEQKDDGMFANAPLQLITQSLITLDSDGKQLRKITDVATKAPTKRSDPTKPLHNAQLCVHGSEIFVASAGELLVRVFDLDGNTLRTFGNEQLTRALGEYRAATTPDGKPSRFPTFYTGPRERLELAISAQGEVFVALWPAKVVLVFALAGQFLRQFSLPSHARHLCLDLAGNLLVCNDTQRRIEVYRQDGRLLWSFETQCDARACFVDSHGQIFVLDPSQRPAKSEDSGELTLIYVVKI